MFNDDNLVEQKFKCRNTKITFKPYDQNQIFMIDFDCVIPKNHVVREINTAIDNMNIDMLLEKYLPGGTSSYNPRMMLKILIFAYTQKIYSSRRIATALSRDTYFMWLAGMNTPDFRTINNFRSEKMKNIIEKVLGQMVVMLASQGYVNLDDYFVDGTKIEASANKYSFVWKGSSEKYKQALEKKVNALMHRIDELNKTEDNLYANEDLPENKPISSEDIIKFSEELNRMLDETPDNKEIKNAKKVVEEEYIPKMQKYEKQLEIIGDDRNSYSKTDNDATFMRMKEDYMKNGQLKPGYNVQIGTQNQFVLNSIILQDRNDNSALIPMIENLEKNTGLLPKNCGADSGYGNEQNYEYLKNRKIGNYVKFTYFHKEQKKKYRENKFLVDNLEYDKVNDEYICPAEKRLKYVYTNKRKTQTGYEQTIKNYECEDCSDCLIKDKCTKAKGNRIIGINTKLNFHKNLVRKNLTSKKGLMMRSKRPVEVESVFGQIKWNSGFKRFLLRGIDKVEIEWILLCLANNFKKLTNCKQKAVEEAMQIAKSTTTLIKKYIILIISKLSLKTEKEGA